MIKESHIRNVFLVALSIALLWAMFKYHDNTVRINGCIYERITEPDGTEILFHSTICGCIDSLVTQE